MNEQIKAWSCIFCQNIRYLRKAHRLTQAQMAQIMGVGVHSVRLLEQGVLPKRLSFGVLYTLCDYFDLPASTLFAPME